MTTDPLAPLLSLADVAPAVNRAREQVDQALRHRALRRQGGQVAAEVSLRSAVASAALEGYGHERETVRDGTVTDPVVQGALRVAGALPGLAELWPRAPRQVLARLHVLAARGLVPEDALGRPTATPPGGSVPGSSVPGGSLPGRSLVNGSGPDGSGLDGSGPDGSGPDGSDAERSWVAESALATRAVSARLDGLAELVAGGTAVSPLILAAVVHGEILALRPFAGPSGVVARAAARLTLLSTGLDPRGLIAVDLGHLERQPEYVGAAGAFATGTADGIRSWLRHYAAAIEIGAGELVSIGDEVLDAPSS